MNNNFFDNYTKKTTGEVPKPQSQPQQPQQSVSKQPSQQMPSQNSMQNRDDGDMRLGVPVQSEQRSTNVPMQNKRAGTNMPVQNEQNRRSVQNTQTPSVNDMNFEQRSGFKPPEPKISTTNSNKPKPMLYALIAGGVAIIAIVVTIILLSGANNATLPDMMGWTKTNVDLWASENNSIVRYVETYSDDIEENIVMSQNPSAGESLPSGTFLEISLSAGPDLSVIVALPDFMNMTRNEVDTWAEQNHMTKVRITSEYSETVELGKVIEFTVNDESVVGTEVRRDTPVYITFSNGSENTGPVTLPDFTTMSVDDAKEFAQEKNIVLEITEKFDDEVPKGTIISQDIKAEEVIQGGDTVKIEVSLGREIIVPNFAQYSREEGSAIAGSLGISTSIEERYSGSDEGRLISQSVESGTHYVEGEIITLTYSLGNEFLLQSYVGQSEDSIKAWANEVNDSGASIKISSTYTPSSQPKGSILSQNKENTTIGISTTISIVVSAGNIIYVPDFVAPQGLTYADAITREDAIKICDEIGIVPIFKAQSADGRLPGEVWSQSLEAGIQIEQGDTIELKYVPVNTSVAIPDFTGMTKAEIELAGYGYQFELVFEEGVSELSAADTVFMQSQRANSVVAPGTLITLTINTGFEPEPEPEPEPDSDAQIPEQIS